MSLEVYEEFLNCNYKDDIINLLNEQYESNHASITINLTALKNQNNKFYWEVINYTQPLIHKWNKALLNVQFKISNEECFLDVHAAVKHNCHVRFINLPPCDDILSGSFPDDDCVGLFVQVKGNVIQISQEKLIEIKREMICSKCSSSFVFEAQYQKMYRFDVPHYCLNSENCHGVLRSKNNVPKPEFCMDFQQIRVQELAAENENYRTTLVICLENDLVNSCKPGECLTICGLIEVRWHSSTNRSRDIHALTLRANSIVKDSIRPNIIKDFNERMFCVRAKWQEQVEQLGVIKARNLLVDSLCPQITGMSFVKLGIVLALCSGYDVKRKQSTTKRGHSHVLLVGDSGTGKSKLLKAACQAIIGSINTNGLGCSAAGLTAAAFKDGSEWNLQAGALVLADGGLCCIDQFNLMQKHDKAAVHETMEQQTISIAKAGLVCKLQSQCVILASANLKTMCKSSGNDKFNSLNFGIATPLLSRFDLIFDINDERDYNWDCHISSHLLSLNKFSDQSNILDLKYWNQQALQSHFIAVKEINPKFNEVAHIILGSYYKYYRSNFQRDLSRTTVRMLDSINRLAQSHARLTFRDTVLAYDAIVIIQLVEATWGFGKIFKPINFNANTPLCTSNKVINIILCALNLLHLKENVIAEKNHLLNECNDSLRLLNMYSNFKNVSGYLGEKQNDINDSEISNTEKRLSLTINHTLNIEKSNKNSSTKPNSSTSNIQKSQNLLESHALCLRENEKIVNNFNNFNELELLFDLKSDGYFDKGNKWETEKNKKPESNLNDDSSKAETIPKLNSKSLIKQNSFKNKTKFLPNEHKTSINIYKTQNAFLKVSNIFNLDTKCELNNIRKCVTKISPKSFEQSFNYDNITHKKIDLKLNLNNPKTDQKMSEEKLTKLENYKRKYNFSEAMNDVDYPMQNEESKKVKIPGPDDLNGFKKILSQTTDLSFLDFDF